MSFIFKSRVLGSLVLGRRLLSANQQLRSLTTPGETNALSLSFDEFKFHTPDVFCPSSTPLLITHGLLGCKTNWNYFARAIAKGCNRTVITFDARNHGESPDSTHMNYEVMMEDVSALAESLNIKKFVFLGHSMGGRTAMCFGLKYPERLAGLIVVDVSPLTISSDFELMKRYTETMAAFKFDNNITLADAKKKVDAKLEDIESDPDIRAFLIRNLHKGSGRVDWRPNLEILLKNIYDIKAFPSKFLSMKSPVPTLFIRGEKSNYVPLTDYVGIKVLFSNAEFVTIDGTGHWPQADKPQDFINNVIAFLRNVE